jgi:hypothetical protein
VARRKSGDRRHKHPGPATVVGGDAPAVVVLVRMAVADVERIDAAAEAVGVTRSAWLRRAVEAALSQAA